MSASDRPSRRRLRLEEERDQLLEQLDRIDRELAEGSLDEIDHANLRDDLTRRAARVLRSLEGVPARSAPATPARVRRLRIASVLAVAVFAVGAGVLVARTSGERLPGELPTGNLERTRTAELAQARQFTQQGEVLAALEVYDSLLAEDPADPEALAERGALLVRTNDERLVPEGAASLDRALEVDPEQPTALVFRAALHRQEGEFEQALSLYERVLELEDSPMPAPVVEGIVDEIRAELAG